MNNLFNQSDAAGILARIEKLSPDSQRQWGKMNVSQMLAHCIVSLETAMGRNFPKRVFMGRIIGRFMKPAIVGEKPLPKNSPTDKSYIITDNRDFAKEKAKVIELIETFSAGGPSKCTTHPQAFFGKMTPEEYAIMQWKHFDHHLRQFGA
jgi:murein endopeptidase